VRVRAACARCENKRFTRGSVFSRRGNANEMIRSRKESCCNSTYSHSDDDRRKCNSFALAQLDPSVV
jgi:hypothetical protein